MRSKHPEVPIDTIGDANANGNGDIFDESAGPSELDVKEKEPSVKLESKDDDYDGTINADAEYAKNNEPDMMELKSMAWHHPAPKRARYSNPARMKSFDMNGDEDVIYREENQHEPDQNEENSETGVLEEPVKEESGTPVVPKTASCRINGCREEKIHFHCHLCDFYSFKVFHLCDFYSFRDRNIHIFDAIYCC